MTRKEAIKALRLERGIEINGNAVRVAEFLQGLDVAISALRHRIWEDQLWHDAKTDPPKTPGLYYGKNDDTNSMYACQYRDGVWVLDMYPRQKMEIVQWADYTAFARENEETSLRPVSREQVEKVFPGCKHCTKQKVPFCYDGASDSVYILTGNGLAAIESDSWGFLVSYCPRCGRPLTDEAVDMVMERLEATYEQDND